MSIQACVILERPSCVSQYSSVVPHCMQPCNGYNAALPAVPGVCRMYVQILSVALTKAYPRMSGSVAGASIARYSRGYDWRGLRRAVRQRRKLTSHQRPKLRLPALSPTPAGLQSTQGRRGSRQTEEKDNRDEQMRRWAAGRLRNDKGKRRGSARVAGLHRSVQAV